MSRYIITRDAIAAFAGTDKVHFLNANARRLNKSLGDLAGLSSLGFHLIEVPPGCDSTEQHAHWFEDECVYILEGEAEATIGDAVHTVGAGDFLGYPAGGPAHALRNIGAGPLKCIVAGTRLDHDVADYPRLGKRLYRSRGRPWNLVDIEAIEEVSTAGSK
jgi:uncharacterized cupin superfamily protein